MTSNNDKIREIFFLCRTGSDNPDQAKVSAPVIYHIRGPVAFDKFLLAECTNEIRSSLEELPKAFRTESGMFFHEIAENRSTMDVELLLLLGLASGVVVSTPVGYSQEMEAMLPRFRFRF